MDNNNELQYLNLLRELVDVASLNRLSDNRTDVKTYKAFGKTLEFDLTDNKIPLLTTKKVNYNLILHELIWMYVLKNPDTSYLEANNVKIWDEWSVPQEDSNTIGEMYGQILRDFKYDASADGETPNIDQVQRAIDILKASPGSRRSIFTSFDPRAAADETKTFEENVDNGCGVLNPCHGLINQFVINYEGDLEFLTFQRSGDIFLGVPFNLAFYATLAHVVAKILGLKAVKMVYVLGDVHLYSNHLEQAKEQLSRSPYLSPTITIDPMLSSLDDLKFSSITLNGYEHHAFIKAQVAV